ncbi:MAG TPA: hypothetical protein VEQ67_08950 [Mycobacterium sp.]|nr:hypothetical protein [Mycobacterium sp.]
MTDPAPDVVTAGCMRSDPVVVTAAPDDVEVAPWVVVGLVCALDDVPEGASPAGTLVDVGPPVVVATAADGVGIGVAAVVVTAADGVGIGVAAVVVTISGAWVTTGACVVTISGVSAGGTVACVCGGVSTVAVACGTVVGTASVVVGTNVSVTGAASAGTIPVLSAANEIAAPEASATATPQGRRTRRGAGIVAQLLSSLRGVTIRRPLTPARCTPVGLEQVGRHAFPGLTGYQAANLVV